MENNKIEHDFAKDTFTGKLCFFFPFQLKSSVLVFKRFRKEWESVAKSQRRIVQHEYYPSTELMDNKRFIQGREEVLTKLMYDILIDVNHACAPFATPCLKLEYESSREDNLFAKEASVVVSRFNLTFAISPNSKKQIVISGTLLFSLNMDNMVGTSILVLNFDCLTIREIILLKHHIYKRGAVSITHKSICPHYQCPNCTTTCQKTELKLKIKDEKKTTVQQYVIDNTPFIEHAKCSMDSRARYSILEINQSAQSINKHLINALINADEGWEYSKNITKYKSLSSRDSHDFYLSNTNGLIISDSDKYDINIKKEEEFFKDIGFITSHCPISFNQSESCIPGVCKHYFPPFLRAVEISYLINDVVTSEITPQKKSYFNPLTIIRRGYKLWQLIYDLDINKYHISHDIHSSFGIDTSMQEIRNEYKDLVTHAISYLAVAIAVVTLIVTVLE